MNSLPGGQLKHLSKINQTALSQADQVLGDEFLPVASNESCLSVIPPTCSRTSPSKPTPQLRAFGLSGHFIPIPLIGIPRCPTIRLIQERIVYCYPDKDCGGEVSSRFAGRNCSLGVIQESTKTEAKRNYELGVWIKNQQPS